MARHPGRSGAQWNRVRAQVLEMGRVCWLCGESIDFLAKPRSPRSPSVDHVVPLKAMRSLPLSEQRRLALDPGNLRPAHYGCNSGRGARRPKQRKASRRW